MQDLPDWLPLFSLSAVAVFLEAAQAGVGIAIAPVDMFTHLLNSERIVQPFATQIDLGSYWLTRLQSKAETPAMREFVQWLVGKMQN